jgi:pyruvate kinase
LAEINLFFIFIGAIGFDLLIGDPKFIIHPVQIIGLSPNLTTSRKMQLVWGVNSCHTEDAHNTTDMVKIACTIAKNKQLVKPDDNIIITAGVPFGNAGSTNLLRITKIIADKNLN